jgi:hypothetical protein
VGGADHRPFLSDLAEAAEEELSEASRRLDLTEHRLDDLLAQAVPGQPQSVAAGGPFCTPTQGPFCAPIDTRPRGRAGFAMTRSRSTSSTSRSRAPSSRGGAPGIRSRQPKACSGSEAMSRRRGSGRGCIGRQEVRTALRMVQAGFDEPDSPDSGRERSAPVIPRTTC